MTSALPDFALAPAVREPMVPSRVPKVHIGGFETVAITRHALAERMVADSLQARDARESGVSILPKLVFSSNGQGISLAGRDPEFAAMMSAADLVHADGMSVVFASRLLGRPLPERIATTDFFHDAAKAAGKHGLRFFIFGASEEQNFAACKSIRANYPDVEIVGRRNGYFQPSDDAAICQQIVDSGADVLWVALGKPLQEQWCVRNKERLRGVGWVKTCGGLYEFLGGQKKRAPVWMQKFGLEWGWRLLQDPRRLFWRYMITTPHSAYLLASRSKEATPHDA